MEENGTDKYVWPMHIGEKLQFMFDQAPTL